LRNVNITLCKGFVDSLYKGEIFFKFGIEFFRQRVELFEPEYCSQCSDFAVGSVMKESLFVRDVGKEFLATLFTDV